LQRGETNDVTDMVKAFGIPEKTNMLVFKVRRCKMRLIQMRLKDTVTMLIKSGGL
jgi:hypothetical protein